MVRPLTRRITAESLFEEYKDKVYRLAVSMVHNDKDAEDIVQVTFIKVLQNLKYFRYQSNISTWIYKIAYNEALMYLRKKGRQLRLSSRFAREAALAPDGISVNWSKVPDRELLDGELRERIEHAIRRLPIQYRIPLFLHHMEDMPLRSVAGVMGITVATLKSRLHRSLLMLGTEVDGYFKDREERPQGPQQKHCPAWLGFVYDYARGNLDARARGSFEKHIAGCGGCTAFMGRYARALSITNALECRDIPDELRERIESFIFKKK